MKSIRAEFPLLLCTPFPPPWKILSTALDPQLPIAPKVQLLLTPTAARITGHYLLPCVTTIVSGVLRPRNAELHVLGWETSSPAAGGYLYPTCWAFYLISFNLSTGFLEFKDVTHQLWCLCIGFSSSKLLVQLVRNQAAYCRWVFPHMIRFSSYSSTILEP